MTEPKAWYDPEVTNRDVGLSWTPGQFHTQPLYTTPPKLPWAGLTDDELVQIGVATGLERAAAQMIESKLKEKNFD